MPEGPVRRRGTVGPTHDLRKISYSVHWALVPQAVGDKTRLAVRQEFLRGPVRQDSCPSGFPLALLAGVLCSSTHPGNKTYYLGTSRGAAASCTGGSLSCSREEELVAAQTQGACLLDGGHVQLR